VLGPQLQVSRLLSLRLGRWRLQPSPVNTDGAGTFFVSVIHFLWLRQRTTGPLAHHRS
jgi:hypothetical protein